MYRDLPALWKVNSKDYSTRKNKYCAYESFLQKYKEKGPKAGTEDKT